MSESAPISKILAHHSIETIRFDYEVSFDKFTFRIETYDTNVFTPPGQQEPRFYLRLEPHYSSSATVRMILYVESSKKKIYFKTSCWFVTKEGEQWQKNDSTFALSQGGCYTIISRPRNELTTEKNGLLVENILTFYCEFTVDLEHFYEKVTVSKEFSRFDDKQQIVDDLENLLENSSFSDFEFTIGEQKFKVHKAILSSRSPVFKAMFNLDFEEKHGNSVAITDIDGDIFAALLKYIYTSKIPLLESNAVELLMAAEKYQLESLKAICEQKLISQLSPESMFNLLIIADMFGAPQLKEKAMEFISSRATSQDILKALFTNKLFGTSQSKSLMDALRDLVK